MGGLLIQNCHVCLTMLLAVTPMASAQEENVPWMCGNDISFFYDKINSNVRFAIGRQKQQFDQEVATLIATKPDSAVDWDAVFAMWRQQINVGWPVCIREIQEKTTEKHGNIRIDFNYHLTRIVRESKRHANLIYFRSLNKPLADEPVRLISAQAIVSEGIFSLETPRLLNSDPTLPTINHTYFNRWGARVLFQGPILLDRVEFLLPEGFKESMPVDEHLLVLFGLEKLKISVDGRRVIACPDRDMEKAEYLNWIGLAWKDSDKLIRADNIAIYGRMPGRYPFDLRPPQKSEEEAVRVAAKWISTIYATRLKRNATRYLLSHNYLRKGMNWSQVTDLLGTATHTDTMQLVYEQTKRMGEPSFRLAFILGLDGNVEEILLNDRHVE